MLKGQLNRDERAGQLVRLEDRDWVEASSAMALHQMINHGLQDRPDKSDTTFSYHNDPGRFNINQSLEQAQTTKELIFESQFEDVKFHDTADDLFDGGIKEGASLTIRVVPEDQKLDGAWHQVARTWIQQTEGTPKNLTFDKFSVQSLNEPDQERYQIVQTFGGDFIYGFGRQPRIMQLTGSVINGKIDVRVGGSVRSMDWKNALQRRYDRFYRLTRCIHNRQKILIYVEDTIYSGYLLNMQTFTNAETQSMSQVTLSFVIKRKQFARQNDEAIPGFVNSEGRTTTDKTVPTEFLKDARKEDYIQESLLPDIKRAVNRKRQVIDGLIRRIKDTLPNVVDDEVEALRQRAKEVSDQTYRIGYGGEQAQTHVLYKHMAGYPEPDAAMIDTLADDLYAKLMEAVGEQKPIQQAIDEHTDRPASQKEATAGKASTVFEALQEAYEGASQQEQVANKRQVLADVKSSFEKKIVKANNLARQLVRTQAAQADHQAYLDALTGT